MTMAGGGETGESPSGWTTDTLKVYVEARLEALVTMLDERHRAQAAAVDAALTSAEKAVAKAEAASDKRADAQNEFRGQLRDQAATFTPRAEFEGRMQALAEKVDALDKRLDKSEGHGAGLSAGWLYLLGAVAAIGTIFTLYLATR